MSGTETIGTVVFNGEETVKEVPTGCQLLSEIRRGGRFEISGGAMGGHHLILGELEDIISGQVVPDTHDERYRQKIARLLLEQAGYSKNEIATRHELIVGAENKKAAVFLDFVIRLETGIVMIVKYGPGSIVTRHQPALAAARMLAPYRVPIVVVTNGLEADILDGNTGKVVDSGLNSIPTRKRMVEKMKSHPFQPVSQHQAAMASRLIYAYEVDGSCPCDDTICRLPEGEAPSAGEG